MSLCFPISCAGKKFAGADSPCQYQGCEPADTTTTYLFAEDCSVIKQSNATGLAQNWGNGGYLGSQVVYGIHIGSNLTTWGNSLFRNNPNIEQVYVPATSTSCGIYAFWGATNLHTATLAGRYHAFGAYSFRYCNNLTTLNFCHPGLVVGLNKGTYGAFADCPNLTEVHVPENGWAGQNFYDGRTVVRDLPPVTPTAVDTVAYAADGNIVNLVSGSVPYGWLNANTHVTSITFGTGTTTTGDRAFKNNESLTSVEIPEWITLIDTYSFESCGSLTRVDIPRLSALPTATGNPFYQSYPTIHLPVNHPTTATQYANRPLVKDLPAM